MANLQKPTIKASTKSTGFSKQNILIIAQGAGTALERQVVENVRDSKVDELFGNSLLKLGIEEIRKFNGKTNIEAIPLKEPDDGEQAVGSIKIIGNAEDAGDLKIKVFDKNFEINLAIIKDESGDDIATKINLAINNLDIATSEIDSTESNKVNVTFFVKGSVGNGLVITTETDINGLDFENEETEGGSGIYEAPNFEELPKRYHTIVFDECLNPDSSGLVDWLDKRLNKENEVVAGSAFMVVNKTYDAVKNYGNSFDSSFIAIFSNSNKMKFNKLPILAASQFIAKRTIRLEDKALIADLVSDPREILGGPRKLSLPYQNTPMDFDLPKGILSLDEAEKLTDAGISLFIPDGNRVVVREVVTTFKTLNGKPASIFKYQNAVDTMLGIKEYFYNRCRAEFAQTRATLGSIYPGVAMTNPTLVKGFVKDIYNELALLILVPRESSDVEKFTKSLTVDLIIEQGVYNIFMQVEMMSQLRGINAILEIGYSF